MSSKRRQRRNRCTDKARHATEADAQYAAFQMHKQKGCLLHPYQCSFCQTWHLGHTRKLRRREGLRRSFALELAEPDKPD